jgi:hypothetical protein
MRKRNDRSSPSCNTRLRACWASQRLSGLAVTGDVHDPPRRQRDEEQELDPLEERRLDGET